MSRAAAWPCHIPSGVPRCRCNRWRCLHRCPGNRLACKSWVQHHQSSAQEVLYRRCVYSTGHGCLLFMTRTPSTISWKVCLAVPGFLLHPIA